MHLFKWFQVYFIIIQIYNTFYSKNSISLNIIYSTVILYGHPCNIPSKHSMKFFKRVLFVSLLYHYHLSEWPIVAIATHR